MNINVRLRSSPPIKLRFQPGASGPSGTVSVGATTTGAPGTDAAVTNSGTPSAAILNFTVPRGDTGDPGLDGDPGYNGWTPEFALVTDGIREVQQVVDWFGGTGTKPATGLYVGPTGLVVAIGDAKDIRGEQGPSGSVTDGDKGDITVSSAGTAWTIDSRAVTFAKVQAIATSRILGRTTASSGDVEELTGAQTTALLSAFTGDSGSGGAKGLVPAPASGDAAKFLAGDGSWKFTQWDQIGATVSVSGSPSTIAFTSLPAGYQKFKLSFAGIAPATDDVYLALQVQIGGSTWVSTSSNYSYSGRMQGPGGGADMGSTTDTLSSLIALTRVGSGNGIGNASGEVANGEVVFSTGAGSTYPLFESVCAYMRSDAVAALSVVAGSFGGTPPITGVRLVLGSGNFANVGTVKLMGLRA